MGEGPPPEIIEAPENLHAPQPHYTAAARKARIRGVVVTEAIIDETGKVVDVNLLRTLHPDLDRATIQAIIQWRFKPARDGDGNPVACGYTLTVNFRLQ